MDPNRDVNLRHEYIEVLGQFEPIDAVVLEEYAKFTDVEDKLRGKPVNIGALGVGQLSLHTVALSVDNLVRLNCMVPKEPNQHFGVGFYVTPLGRQLIRACRP